MTKINSLDIFNPSRLADILALLSKDQYSMSELNSMDLENVFIAYYQMIDRNLLDAALYWFKDTMEKIKREVDEKVTVDGSKSGEMRERTDFEKEFLEDQLEEKYFIDEIKEKTNE